LPFSLLPVLASLHALREEQVQAVCWIGQHIVIYAEIICKLTFDQGNHCCMMQLQPRLAKVAAKLW
jgi:hypothetical protein